MTKILFVCHGNICRSPMAEFIMKKLVADHGAQFHIESRATSTEELGNPVYPPARRKLSEHGISCDGKFAQRITRKDYESFDYVICMDGRNLRNISYVIGEDDEAKISRLMDYTDTRGDVADPWYTDDFETAYRDILRGCEGLLKKLTNQ